MMTTFSCLVILILSPLGTLLVSNSANPSHGQDVDIPVSMLACSDNDASNDSWSVCPPWATCNPARNKCECSDYDFGEIRCGQSETQVAKCHCLTYHDEAVQFKLGPCFFNCGSRDTRAANLLYYSVPSNLSLLNSAMCGFLNRTGTLCGECLPGHAPLAYMHCVKCPDSGKNWWKFILAAFLPLTVFYVVVLLFKVSITPPYLYCYIFYTQAVTTPTFVRTVVITKGAADDANFLDLIRVTSSLYNMWSLDFFRAFYGGFCLGLDTLQTLALEYTIAFYPLFLIFLTYLFRKLYENDCTLIVFFWKHLNLCLSVCTNLFTDSENTRSLIDAYAVFFILSLTKIVYVSFDLLAPVSVDTLKADGSRSSYHVLYYDGSYKYFGSDHLPYAILAFFVMTLLVIFPLLVLLLYPCKFFHLFLNKFPGGFVIPLHHFVDKFQGYYKNGMNGTRDYRYFSVLHTVLLLVLYIVYACTLSQSYHSFASGLLMIAGVLYLCCQPYKKAYSHYTTVTSAFFILLSSQYTLLATALNFSTRNNIIRMILFVLVFILALLPTVYIVALLSYWLANQCSCGRKYIQKFMEWHRVKQKNDFLYGAVEVN